MDFIFDFFAGIFQYPMMWFYQLTGKNYLLALFLFTLLVKLVFLPFSIKQQKTQIKSAKLRPKIAIIEKKYKGRTDRDSLQQKQTEIMELQQKEGVSPFGGCLPLLLQLPVLLGIYQVVRKPFSYLLGASQALLQKCHLLAFGQEAENIGAVDQISLMKELLNKDIDYSSLVIRNEAGEIVEQLQELPNMQVFDGFNLADTPNVANFGWLLLIPVFSFVFSYLSMKITRKLNAPATVAATTPETQMSNKIMELSLPLMSLFIAFSVPAAVGVYWMFNSALTIIQTVILAKAMPLPTFTEEELRQYEKEMKASRARTRQASANRPVVRSRHHIDDDDYETAPLPKTKKNTKPVKSGGIEALPTKDESDKNKKV